MCSSKPKTPAPPPEPPRAQDPAVRQARLGEKRRQRIAFGRASTVKTSGLGSASTTGNALLGE